MASAKGGGVRLGCGWQPGCQSNRQPLNSGAVATWLPLQESARSGMLAQTFISNGNQVATQEGR